MRPAAVVPVHKDVVLLGGGHSHVEVLRRFGMKPQPGVRLTIITPTLSSPYSGMIPGFVSGFYSLEECHIDLSRLARYANARVIVSSATSIDIDRRKVILEGDRPPLGYDVLSINVGITPACRVPGAEKYVTPVKPISSFASKLEKLIQNYQNGSNTYRIVVVGGGPGGVELACALQYRLGTLSKTIGRLFKVSLVSKGKILSTLSSMSRSVILPLMKERGIDVIECDGGVTRVDADNLSVSDHSVAFDECLWCTQAGAPGWLRGTGLPVDKDGFLLVNEYLQSDGGPPEVFGAGDCVTISHDPRPKAGVYAVRAGPFLSENIERSLQGKELRAWYPQSSHLNLISCGDKYAVAAKGWIAFHASWLWRWKDSIDVTFMNKYGKDLKFMQSVGPNMDTHPVSEATKELIQQASMRCGACGSKIGSSILSRVLGKIANKHVGNDMLRIEWDDDAAILPRVPDKSVAIQTVDFFRAPKSLQDPYIFGYISAVHAMSDCYAMNAMPSTALAIPVIPFAAAEKIEDDLYQMMSGSIDALKQASCRLIGGHTSEGEDMALGFSVTGMADEKRIWKRSDALPDDTIILIKSLGTGIILAAAESGLPVGNFLSNAILSMCNSNGPALPVLQKFSVHACTDITGFGLLGHLIEILESSDVSCNISLDAIPLLEGVAECISLGISSSLLPENSQRVDGHVAGSDIAKSLGLWEALLDPQTSGGLLFSLPRSEASQCLHDLHEAGFKDAQCIGNFVPSNGDAFTINLK